eukprot:5162344-Alexandrium_andersonii.AAC.1
MLGAIGVALMAAPPAPSLRLWGEPTALESRPAKGRFRAFAAFGPQAGKYWLHALDNGAIQRNCCE